MKVIIAYTDADLARAAKVLAELNMADNPASVVIDAHTKPSASTA